MAKYEEINLNKTKKLNEKKYGNKLNYFDLICNEINEINPKESTIPTGEFFEDSYLNNDVQIVFCVKYIYSIMDLFSRKAMIYPLKNKGANYLWIK